MEKEYINQFGEIMKVDEKGRFMKGFKHNDKRKEEIGLISKRWHQENKNTKAYKERKNKILKGLIGHKVSDKARKLISEKNKNKHYSLQTEFKKGLIPWNKGIKAPQISKAQIGRKASEKTKLKQSKIRKERIALGLIKIPKGEESSSWLGGKSFEPYNYKFNKEFKNLVRLRDNFCCLNCGISEQKSIILRNRALSIHHIDYNKLNTCLMNCCTLCTICNNKANFNRKYWEGYFQNLLNKKYYYNYKDNKIKSEEVLQGTYIIG